MLHSHWVSPGSPVDPGRGWSAGNARSRGGAGHLRRGSRMHPGACSGSEHRQLRGWCVSGRAGLSLPLPQDPKSSPAPRGLSTAQCPQEASQADRFTPPRTVWPGWPAPKCPRLQRAPSVLQPGLQHQFTEALRAVATCVPASAALSSPDPLFIKPPKRPAFTGQCAPC